MPGLKFHISTTYLSFCDQLKWQFCASEGKTRSKFNLVELVNSGELTFTATTSCKRYHALTT